MIIETQATSDSNALNFFPPQKLLPENRAEFIDSKSLRRSPFAENIFDRDIIYFYLRYVNNISFDKIYFVVFVIILRKKKKDAHCERLIPPAVSLPPDYLFSCRLSALQLFS